MFCSCSGVLCSKVSPLLDKKIYFALLGFAPRGKKLMGLLGLTVDGASVHGPTALTSGCRCCTVARPHTPRTSHVLRASQIDSDQDSSTLLSSLTPRVWTFLSINVSFCTTLSLFLDSQSRHPETISTVQSCQ